MDCTTLIAAPVKARVAVLSLCWASAIAASSSFTPVFTPSTGGFDVGDGAGVGVVPAGVEDVGVGVGGAWPPPIVNVYS
jgi:hypothetical protein